jgi:hypothetical protein
MPCWKNAHHGRTPRESLGIRQRGHEAIEADWRRLESSPFPAGLDNDQRACVVMVDADASGCVSTYLASGMLDLERRRTLQACEEKMVAILPALAPDAASYVGLLLGLTQAVLHQTKEDFLGA